MTIRPPSPKPLRRIWHTPTSWAAKFWAVFSLVFCLTFSLLYILRREFFLIREFNTIYHCGIAAYVMILSVTTYSLRTRFLRGLPGKAQNWLWMHMCIGVSALLIALLHENFRFVLYGFCSTLSCLTDQYLGVLALYSLILIAGSGLVGRYLDRWQARVIAQDASSNGVGIARAIKSRLLELQYMIERLSAGKSQAFKQYCTQTLQSIGELPMDVPQLAPHEQIDFQRAYIALSDHARLAQSLVKQERAQSILRIWRRLHMALVPLFLLIITYHAIMQFTTVILHLG